MFALSLSTFINGFLCEHVMARKQPDAVATQIWKSLLEVCGTTQVLLRVQMDLVYHNTPRKTKGQRRWDC